MKAFRPLESPIETQVVNRIWYELGIMGIKLKAVGQTGWPDRWFPCPGGRSFLIEFKRPGEEPEPRQLYIHNQLRKLGFHVEVHDDEDTAVAAIRRFVGSPQVPKNGDEISDRARRRRSLS